ncbi:MAG TPA: DUF5677 domain-containing protein [Flavobacterium sp.]|nr:DUF5677 domain-containing protein [Flavobacterium sp.]
MIQSIDDLKKLDEEISAEFAEAHKFLHYLLMESEQKRTAEICFAFMTGTNYLKSSLFDCAENEDYYSMSVLLRSLTEHYLRFNYFWLNYSKTKSENYAMKFVVSLEFYERLTIENAINAAKQIKHEEIKTSDQIWEEIKKSNREFEVYSKQEIDEFSKNLSIKNIIRYIERNMKESGFDTNDFLQRRIVEYAQLSSFVHGGIYAFKRTVDLGVSKDRERIVIGICGTALQMASSIKIWSYLVFSTSIPEFKDFYDKTLESLKKLR